MEEGLKQRLVGAAVLVLLAVIFVPMLLDSGSEPGEVGLDLGPPPNGESGFSSRIIPVEESPSEVPKERVALEAGSSEGQVGREEKVKVATSPIDDSSQTTTVAIAVRKAPDDDDSMTTVVIAPDSPASAGVAAALEEADEGDVAGKVEGEPPAPVWAAQLGSFAERRNALVLRNRLRAKGYSAFTESVTNDQGKVTRVLVGPEPTRERTLSTIEALRRDTGLDGFVVRHPRQ